MGNEQTMQVIELACKLCTAKLVRWYAIISETAYMYSIFPPLILHQFCDKSNSEFLIAFYFKLIRYR